MRVRNDASNTVSGCKKSAGQMVRNQNENYPFLKKREKKFFIILLSESRIVVRIRKYRLTFTRISIVKQTTLTIRLPHCLTSAVRLGKGAKAELQNCSCKNCSCAGHDGQIICQPVAPDVVRYVYTQTHTYTHMQKHTKKENVKGYEKLP